MDSRRKTTDHPQIMQIAAWMWLLYLVLLAAIDRVIYTGVPFDQILWYYLINGCPALFFLGLAYSSWLKSWDKSITLIMILLISGGTILVYHLFNLRLPPAPLSNLEGMVLRQLPVLFIGLVLVAWNYNMPAMVVFSVAVNAFEFVLTYSMDRLENQRFIAFTFILLIRMVCFIVVGVFVNQLIAYLRSQQEKLEIANQQLSHYASTLETLTVSRERNRMSRELHDTVVHTLSGLSVQLETMKAYLGINSDTVRSLLDQSIEATRNGLNETRLALKAFRASPLEDLGLIRALEHLSNLAAKRGNLDVNMSFPDRDLILSPDVEQSIYRIGQEAVENVIHHANAQHLTVRLSVVGDEIVFEIQDDGIGFSQEIPVPAGHFGLVGMRERAQLVGGELTIHSKLKHGTAIRFMVKDSYHESNHL